MGYKSIHNFSERKDGLKAEMLLVSIKYYVSFFNRHNRIMI
jgi:hypothetical protein